MPRFVIKCSQDRTDGWLYTLWWLCAMSVYHTRVSLWVGPVSTLLSARAPQITTKNGTEWSGYLNIWWKWMHKKVTGPRTTERTYLVWEWEKWKEIQKEKAINTLDDRWGGDNAWLARHVTWFRGSQRQPAFKCESLMVRFVEINVGFR